MIELIIPYINTKIEALNMFSKLYGLCEIIKKPAEDTKNEVSFPAEYCEKEYNQVSDFDQENGTVYHRLTGDITSAEADEESAISCDPFIERVYPMRTVGAVKKSTLNAYEDSTVAEYVANAISFLNNKTLRAALKADVIGVEVKGISTDREKIFTEEYKGVQNTIPYEYTYFAIDYNIKVTGNVSCFSTNEC